MRDPVEALLMAIDAAIVGSAAVRDAFADGKLDDPDPVIVRDYIEPVGQSRQRFPFVGYGDIEFEPLEDDACDESGYGVLAVVDVRTRDRSRRRARAIVSAVLEAVIGNIVPAGWSVSESKLDSVRYAHDEKGREQVGRIAFYFELYWQGGA